MIVAKDEDEARSAAVAKEEDKDRYVIVVKDEDEARHVIVAKDEDEAGSAAVVVVVCLFARLLRGPISLPSGTPEGPRPAAIGSRYPSPASVPVGSVLTWALASLGFRRPPTQL